MILEHARPVEDIDPQEYFIKALLGGPSGSGKTTSACTLPGKKLLIDLDDRAESVYGLPDIEVIKILEPNPKSPTAWSYFNILTEELVYEFSAGRRPYDAIIIDGMTEMTKVSLNWSLLLDPKRGLGGCAAKQHYGPQMKEFEEKIKTLRSLPCHVAFTCHLELIDNEEGGPAEILPKATGKLRTAIPGWFNETYYCFRTTEALKEGGNKTRYHWLTAGNDRYNFFKSSLNAQGKFWKDPITVDLDVHPAGFQQLLQLRFGDRWTEGKEA